MMSNFRKEPKNKESTISSLTFPCVHFLSWKLGGIRDGGL